MLQEKKKDRDLSRRLRENDSFKNPCSTRSESEQYIHNQKKEKSGDIFFDSEKQASSFRPGGKSESDKKIGKSVCRRKKERKKPSHRGKGVKFTRHLQQTRRSINRVGRKRENNRKNSQLLILRDRQVENRKKAFLKTIRKKGEKSFAAKRRTNLDSYEVGQTRRGVLALQRPGKKVALQPVFPEIAVRA